MRIQDNIAHSQTADLFEVVHMTDVNSFLKEWIWIFCVRQL